MARQEGQSVTKSHKKERTISSFQDTETIMPTGCVRMQAKGPRGAGTRDGPGTHGRAEGRVSSGRVEGEDGARNALGHCGAGAVRAAPPVPCWAPRPAAPSPVGRPRRPGRVRARRGRIGEHALPDAHISDRKREKRVDTPSAVPYTPSHELRAHRPYREHLFLLLLVFLVYPRLRPG